jgi:tetratricopeptide (TPR) repeat protein
MYPWQQMLVLLSGGVIGGFIAGQRDCSQHKILLPSGRKIELGIIGDALIGAATSLSVYGAAIASKLASIPEDNDTHLLLKLIAVGIIAGFAGIPLLSGISDRLVRDVQGVKKRVESVERKEESLRKSIRGDSLLEQKRYEEAERIFNDALSLDPDNELAVIGLAKVFRWTGRIEQAILLLTEFINRKRDASRAIYNRACYKALLNQNREAISDLKRAIQLDPFYHQYAQKDPDFESIRSDPEFPGFTSAPEAPIKQLDQPRERREETHENK